MFKNRFILILIIISVILPSVLGLLNFYTDWLFFVETGFSSVFMTTLYAKIGAGLLFGLLLFVFLQLNIYFANRAKFPLSGIHILGGGNFRINRDQADLLVKPLSLLISLAISP